MRPYVGRGSECYQGSCMFSFCFHPVSTVFIPSPRSRRTRADKTGIAIRHPHVHWIVLVLWIYPSNRYFRLHQPRSELSY